MIKVVIFDFDGVLADSNEIKHRAYFDLTDCLAGADTDTVSQVVEALDPSPRRIIIKEIVKRWADKGLLDEKDIDKQVALLVDSYSRICLDAIATCPEIHGAKDALKYISSRYATYVNSLTPIDSLCSILKKRDIFRYFKGSYGSEEAKEENLRRIMAKEHVAVSEIVVVGDGLNDLACAENTGAEFIGIANELLRKKKYAYKWLPDCRKLAKTIDALNHSSIESENRRTQEDGN